MTSQTIAKQITDCFKRGGCVWVFGNGGSLADASHWAAEFQGLGPVIALNDPVKITAIANDNGFKYVFYSQIVDLGKEGDLAIGISSSGKSENVNMAIQVAFERGLETIAWPIHEIPQNPKEVAETQNRQYQLMHDVFLLVREKLKHDN